MKSWSIVIAVAVFFAAGCQVPQWRVFQKTVPVDTGPSAQNVEAQRRAAALIVDLSNPGFDVRISGIELTKDADRLAKIHSVAVPLSSSLGEPLKRATVFEVSKVIIDTQASLREAQAKADKWREFSRKHAGIALEDTGINLAGPAGLLGLVAVIAACVFVPGFGYVLLRLVPVLWGMVKRMTVGIESFAADAPEQGKMLKEAYLSRKMDAIDKKIVKRRKKAIRPEELNSSATPVTL